MPEKVKTIHDSISGCVDNYLRNDFFAGLLHDRVVEELTSFDALAMTQYLYRFKKTNTNAVSKAWARAEAKQGSPLNDDQKARIADMVASTSKHKKEREEKAGTITATFYKHGKEITCHIIFTLCNPTDKWDDHIVGNMLGERMFGWGDCNSAYIGMSGETDVSRITSENFPPDTVFIPHHITRSLYEFVIRVKSLLGNDCKFPKWVYSFIHQYEDELQSKEDARIAEREERKAIKRTKKALKALEGLDKE